MSISTIARPFFLTAALALLGAGLLLTIEGDVAFRSSWDAVTLALAHLGTLGFLSLVMLGLAYQVIASLTKSLPSSSLAYAVNALLVLGIISLVWSLRANATWSVLTSLSALGLGLIGSIVPGALSLRPGWRETTPAALLLALVSLLVTAFLGLWMLHGHGGMSFPGPRGLWVQVHLCVGLLGWVGCLQTALCWHLLPVTRPRAGTEERAARVGLALVGVGVLLAILVLVLDWLDVLRAAGISGRGLAFVAVLPAAAAVWTLQPLQNLRRLSGGRDLKGDTLFLKTGFALSPLTGLAALTAALADEGPWGLLLGWLGIWGWAGLLAHGLLLHASARPGTTPTGVPLSFGLHLASVIAGATAIATGIPWVVRGTGLLLVATALDLGRRQLRR